VVDAAEKRTGIDDDADCCIIDDAVAIIPFLRCRRSLSLRKPNLIRDPDDDDIMFSEDGNDDDDVNRLCAHIKLYSIIMAANRVN
jgi:hypothetical protein